ncbi:DUF4062 domain-containing protein [Hyphomonas sp. WL0036]|uniref:AAA family ATPase n=1 Tax=Hyphomonas sediminis TaxID=2866160 RepID=UPI001C81CCA0|nr:AAA family ATPase [Hyphomonas sediminis]MBY9068225.1 DUF4062 domain-containing protein [Hyphomonas sediminis]
MFAKAFRLFVSSTFQDFGEERRLLQERVFPVLEAHCAKEGFGLRTVDMRWGVNDDAQLNQRTAEICLGEVIEAQGYPAPNILILIGDRYGWTPLPFAIARDEYRAVRDWLIARNRNNTVADLERVYALDENHLVPGGLTTAGGDLIAAYTLLSREDDLSELRDPEAWTSVEANLRDGVQAAARYLYAQGQLCASELDKYLLSLTEQEIRKGLEQVAGSDGATAANSIAWVRTRGIAEPPVRALTDLLQKALPGENVLRAELPAESAGYADHFVVEITRKLIAAIDAQIAQFKSRAQMRDFALQTERAIHASFAAERLRVFCGRERNLATIAAHVVSDARHPLVLTGISGSGKTALIAKAAAEVQGAVVQRFVGASASSANQRNLLVSVVEDLAALGVASLPAQWEEDGNGFVNQVRDILAALDQPVAIFIDALDQLRPPYRPMWLPQQLQPQVKLIVSVLDDAAYAAERSIVQGLRRSLPADAFLAIEPLSKEDGADVLAGLQREVQRGLSREQEAFILKRFEAAAASPLFLRIAFAIARRWRSTDDPHTWGLAEDLTALIGQFLDELSTVHHHEPLLVRRALGLIAAGREGLSESEVIAVLSRDAEVMAGVSSEQFGAVTDRLPDSVWVRLKRSLAALLVEKGEEGEPLISFFHRQVIEVVRDRFYAPEKAALHRALAAHFDPSPDHVDADRPWTRRSFAELPFQLFQAGMRERLDALLTDPVWIEGKFIDLRGVDELVSDYQSFANPELPLHRHIGAALRLAGPICARDPRQLMPQLHGRLMSTDNADYAPFIAALEARAPAGALFETRPALTPPGAEIARVRGDDGGFAALAVLPDGSLASGCSDGTIRLWDPADGADVAGLEGHGGWVTALAVLPDGRLASSSSDRTIRLWDPASCTETARLEGHGGWVMALTLLPDGRLASGGRDATIRLWDPTTGAETARLEGHKSEVLALAVLPDGRLASGSSDRTIRLWDLATGVETARLEGHDDGVAALAVLPEGHLASGSSDGTIRLWDPASGAEIARLEGHDGGIMALLVLPDRRLASGSHDRTICMWDPSRGAETARLEGHEGWVTALAVLPDGRLASGSFDRTIRLWDWTTAAVTSALQGDGNAARALAALPDGRLASDGTGATIRLRDPATGAETARLEGHKSEVDALGVRPDGVRALAVLPEGHLASCSSDGTIRLWDPASGAEIARLWGHRGVVNALAVLPDGHLASGSHDRTICLWDPSSGAETARLEGHEGWVTALAVLPDGRLASGSDDRTIRLWDPATGAEVARLEGHGDGIRALVALPDGHLVSGGRDATIRLWDPTTGAEAASLEGHNSEVLALAVLPDGRLASCSSDRTIRLWDPASGVETARLELDGQVLCLAALPGGCIVAGDSLGRLHWLAIKGEIGEVGQQTSSVQRARVSPPQASPTPSQVIVQSTDPLAPAPARPDTHPSGKKSAAEFTGTHASKPPRRKQSASRLRSVILYLTLIAALMVAAILVGPFYGVAQARDAWHAAIELLASWR